MHGLFFLGSARSGAGVATGTLAHSSRYIVGGRPSPTLIHPSGERSDPRVVSLNERLLALALPLTEVLLEGERWLASLPTDCSLPNLPEAEQEIAQLVGASNFCFWDPRFVWTLPEWVRAAPRARRVCVFRDPESSRASVQRTLKQSSTFGEIPNVGDRAMEHWKASYARVLHKLRAHGEWLFLHYAQLFTSEGQARLSKFAEAPLQTAFLRPELCCDEERPSADARANELYSELCELAQYSQPSSAKRTNCPRVAVVVPIRDGDVKDPALLVAELREQRGVELEIVLIDSTEAGALVCQGARVLREHSPSRGRAYLRALEVTSAPWIAWHDPRVRPAPHRLARQVALAESATSVDLVTSDLSLHDGQGNCERYLALDLQAPNPPGLWHATVIVRRERLVRIDPRAFTPAELELYHECKREGRVAHVSEALIAVQSQDQAASEAQTQLDHRLLELARLPQPQEPEVTVLLASHDRCAALIECLEGFARQDLARGTLELLVIDDGSRDRTRKMLRSLELAVPLRFLEQDCKGACTARNRGLPHARGRYLLFVNDDTIPFPDTVRAHLAAQRELQGTRAIVLGTFEQPQSELRQNLVRLLEQKEYVFGYPGFERTEALSGTHFYTCNASISRSAIEELGDFDESFPCYAEDTDYGLRLEQLGYRIFYRPEARAIHRHRMTFDGMRWRQRVVAKAHVRLCRKHPKVLNEYWATLSKAQLEEKLKLAAPVLPTIEAVARELATVDLAALEAAGESCQKAAESLSATLAEVFAKLNSVWWNQGFCEGFVEHGLEHFAEVRGANVEDAAHA